MSQKGSNRLFTDIELILIVVGIIIVGYFIYTKLKKALVREVKKQVTVATVTV